MSTKIYNAYEYKGTLSELIDFMYRMKRDAIAKYTIELCDFYESTGKFPSISEFETEVKDRFKSSWREDGSLSITIVPYEDRMFVVVFGSQTRWLTEILDGQDNFKDFHYQNQVDPPPVEEVSEDEWREREEIWDDIYHKRPYRFSDMGPSYELVGVSDVITLWEAICACRKQREFDRGTRENTDSGRVTEEDSGSSIGSNEGPAVQQQ